jgi:hypothetical protein
MQRDEVAFGENLFEGHEFHGKLARGGFADKWIVGQHAHIESLCT